MRRRAAVIAAAAVAVVAVGGGAAVYLLRDTAPPEADIDALAAPSSSSEPDAPAAPATPDGTWTVEAADDVFVGYRVQEQFAGDAVEKTAAGRTPGVEGEITIDGDRITAASLTADLTRLASDQSRRDAALRTRGLETERFPEASFALTSPVTLPSPPAEGEDVPVTATGDLTLHGVTHPIDIELEGRWDGATIAVAGDATITFADFGIEPIDIAGFVRTAGEGSLELQLRFVPAA